MEQIELYGVIAWPVEDVLVEGSGIRADGTGVLHAVGVLELRGLQRQKRADRRLGRRVAVRPEGF